MNRSFIGLIRIASALLICNQLVGCGGSDGSSTSTTTLTGQFVDAPVNGLNYICSVTGVADSETVGITEGNGNFQYKPGARCLFKVGNVSLGQAVSVGSDGIVTPYDVVSASRAGVSNERAIAVAQFLQTLDSGAESNKISIQTSVRDLLSNVSPTNVASVGAVLSQQDLLDLVISAGKSSLVPPLVAKTALTSYMTTAAISLTSGASPMLYKGVNLAGAEFTPAQVPGTLGTHYIWPTQAEINYFKSLGMNTIRLPFLWERLQPDLGGAFTTAYKDDLVNTVSMITAAGMSVVIDVHNYARYYQCPNNSCTVWDGTTNFVGGVGSNPSNGPTADQFGAFWASLAALWPNDPYVIFGLMNEPTYMPTTTWVNDANVAIAAIRNIGANNLILVPGNCWTGGWSWSGGTISQCDAPNDNATQMLSIVDSANNYAIEIHQYLDSDYSGTDGKDCTHDGAEVLAGVTSWLKANNKRAFLGEFAGINSAACQSAVTNMLSYMNDNAGGDSAGGWIGWTWWAAGQWYGSGDGFSLEPSNIGAPSQADAPQVSWLTPFLQ